MNTVLRMKLVKYICMIWLAGFSFQIEAQQKSVSMKVVKAEKGIEILFQVNKGFGIQKKGPHQITIYSGEKIEKTAKSQNILHDMKQVQFSGKLSKEDKDYFSSVEPVVIPVNTSKPLTIKAKIFFCSFESSFCSMEVIQKVVK
jgi:hypothetical protein